MGMLSVSTAAIKTEDLYDLLLAVLPAFIATAERALRDAERALRDLSELSTYEEKFIRITLRFYLQFYPAIVLLQAILVTHRDSIEESIQRFFIEEVKVQKNLGRILNELETRFVSQSGELAGLAFRRIGFRCLKDDTTYPKLRALWRTLPEDDSLGEDFLKDLDHIIQINSNHSKKRKELLGNLQKAQDFFTFFVDLLPHTSRSESSCPIKFSNHHLVHIWNLTKTLFDTIESNWRNCNESGCTSHISRKTRLHLTKHQRFEIAGGSVSLNTRAPWQFLVLFSTSYSDLKWQSTEITVTNLAHGKNRDGEPRELMKNGLCEIIRNLNQYLRPRMAIYGHKLWKLRVQSVRDTNQAPSVAQPLHDDFISLKKLLQPDGNHRKSLLSSMEAKNLVILSFVLTTSFLRFFRGPWLQASFCSDSICFLAPNSSQPDITKPYLTTSCLAPLDNGAPLIDLGNPHPALDILSLGVLLLEIAGGDIIDIPRPEDRFDIAAEHMKEWTLSQKSYDSIVYDCLHEAISACIVSDNLKKDGLHRRDVTEKEARKYIFERVLWPLESTLYDVFNVKPTTLDAEIAPTEKLSGLGSFDHKDDDSKGKQKAAQVWFKGLDNIIELLDKFQERHRQASKGITPVKVAVLDTGLQIPQERLQNTYKDLGRINTTQSEDFVPSEEDKPICGWEADPDGHGSRVGEIILRVAPEAVIHVAKVISRGEDLKDSNMSEQVHKQIAEASSFNEAIKRASCEWEVDIIVMSFGFDEPISLINEAIENVLVMKSPPLFFAATSNDGANKDMAWPAKDPRVIGVSSTDGYGVKSEFNPEEGETSYPILHAFGEGVPVSTDKPRVDKHVSGTSYATPVAAALVANLLGYIRMIACVAPSADGLEGHSRIPERLQKMSAMIAVLKEHMQKKHENGDRSLLPWDFLNVNNPSILENIVKTLVKTLGRE